MFKKISLILHIPWANKGRHKKITINVYIRNSSRKMKKFRVVVRSICTPWRDGVGQRIDNGMSVGWIENKVSPMRTGVAHRRCGKSTRAQNLLMRCRLMNKCRSGFDVLVPRCINGKIDSWRRNTY